MRVGKPLLKQYLNAFLASLLGKPHLRIGRCVVCGRIQPLNGHHVIVGRRDDPENPVLDLCGSGTTLCHGDAHRRELHFRWRDRWEYLRTERAAKYENVLEMEGWKPCRTS